MLVFASDYPFLDVLWTMLVFFGWVIWFWLLITVFSDLFRRHDIGGWHKAGWVLLCIVLPFIGVLIYLIAQGQHMAERNVKLQRDYQSQVDSHIRDVAGSSPTAEIEKAKQLLDSGAITQEEFNSIKSKALTSG
jgi:hypothetical protein